MMLHQDDWPVLTLPEAEGVHLKNRYAEARVILEYGSGGSTFLAAQMPGKLIISVESDRDWALGLQEKLDRAALPSQAILYYTDIGPTGAWGRPTDEKSWRRFHHYPTAVWSEPFFRHPDTILIDGRFRAACFVNACLRIRRPVTILFDDYVNRPKYHIVERLVQPVALIGRMAEFRLTPQDWPDWAHDLLFDLMTEATFSGANHGAYGLEPSPVTRGLDQILSLPIESLGIHCFLPDHRPQVDPLPVDEIAVIIHVRPGESDLLAQQIQHYRSLGASAFFLLDEAQINSADELCKQPGVHAFRPLPGVSAAIGVAALARMHLAENSWYLVAQSGEFMMLPQDFPSLALLIEHFESIGLDQAAGLLLELLPPPTNSLPIPLPPASSVGSVFTHVCDVTSHPSADYLESPDILADFGSAAALPWRVDANYHATGTVKSLRRTPLLRHQDKRCLAEGLRHMHPAPDPDEDIWQTWPILPMFSYGLSFASPEELNRISCALPQSRPVLNVLAEGFANWG